MRIVEHDWRIEPSRLDAMLSRFNSLRIGLLGDLFLDRYLMIDPGLEETSIETGLPAHQVASIRNAPGALGTVMNNLAALGAGRLAPITVIGDDGHGYDLLGALRKMPVDCGAVFRSDSAMTPTYTKPLVLEGRVPRELSRLDVRSRRILDSRHRYVVIESLRSEFENCDAWMVLDQLASPDCGVVDAQVREALTELIAQRPDIPVLVDSRAQLHRFVGCVVKGNRREITSAVAVAEDACPSLALTRIYASSRQPAFCTDGERGVWAVDFSGGLHHVRGVPLRGPLDIVGAGDAVNAGLVMALALGAEPWIAAQLGNLAASITVRKLGETGVATPAELRDALS